MKALTQALLDAISSRTDIETYSKIKDAPGQQDLFSGEKRRSSKTQGKLRWITLKNADGGGGTHVQVDDKGNIAAGPEVLTGKNLGELKKEPKGRDTEEDEKEPDTDATKELKFETAGEAIKAGRSIASWKDHISQAFTNEEIDEDHPAYQSILHGNSPTVREWEDAKSIIGHHAVTDRGHFGKVTDISDDGKSITMTHGDGETSTQSAGFVGHLGAKIDYRVGKGKDISEHARYMAPHIAAESIANGENVSETMRRHGIKSPQSLMAMRKFVAPEMEKQRSESEPAKAEPSEARAKAMAKQADQSVVNVPLSKRGDIDAQLDKHKANEAKAKKAKASTDATKRKEDKAVARELFDEYGEGLAQRAADKSGKSKKEALDTLESMVKWEPAKARELLERVAAEQAAEHGDADDTSGEPVEETTESEHDEASESNSDVERADESGDTGVDQRGSEEDTGSSSGRGIVSDVPTFNTFLNDLNAGNVTLDELKAGYQQLKSGKDQFVSDLKSKYDANRLKSIASQLGSWDAGRDSKQKNAEYIHGRMLSYFDPTDKGLQYSPFGGSGPKTLEESLDARMAEITQDDLKAYAERKSEKIAQQEKTAENPETLSELSDNLRSVGGYHKMKPEHQAAYDDLKAVETRSRRKEEKQPSTVTATITSEEDHGGFELSTNFHSKRGHDIFTASPGNRVDRDQYNEMNRLAGQLGGWYYKAYKGTPGGFHFPDEAKRDNFLKAMAGEHVDRSEHLAEKTAAKVAAKAETLAEYAARLEEKATGSLNQDRKDNTHKRAQEAASARAGAHADITKARTLAAIAEAVTSGESKHLDGVSAGTHYDELRRAANLARRTAIESQLKEKYGDGWRQLATHNEMESSYGDGDFKPEHAAFAKMPNLNLYKHTAGSVIQEAAKTPGLKQEAAKWAKVLNNSKHEDHFVELSTSQSEAFVDFVQKAKKKGLKEARDFDWHTDSFKRFRAMGLHDDHEVRAALREFSKLHGGAKSKPSAAETNRAKESEIVRKHQAEGFFPTPKSVISQMLDHAEIDAGHSVLEPSAGLGHILDAVTERHGSDVALHSVEQHHELAEHIRSKGHTVDTSDFLEHSGQYDRILMNPPFERDQAIDHVRHAFDQLKPGGKLVAVVPGTESLYANATRGKRSEFHGWASDHGQFHELPDNAFAGDDSVRKTGIKTSLLVLRKPEEGREEYSRDGRPFSMGLLTLTASLSAAIEASTETYSRGSNADDAARYTNTNPSVAQKESGNYEKGRFAHWGHEIVIENLKGSIRSGKDWQVEMPAHYGYIRRTVGRDGDQVDVILGPDMDSEIVFVVNQQTQNGSFDEHKCVLGCYSEREAKELYLSCYSAGWTGLRSVSAMTKAQFLNWLDSGDMSEQAIERYARDANDREHDELGRFTSNAAAELTSLRRSRGSDAAKAAAKGFLNKELTNRDSGIVATVSGRSLGKMLSQSAWRQSTNSESHMEAVGNLDTLFSHAIHSLSRDDRKDEDHIGAMHHFEVPFAFDGEILKAKILAKEFSQADEGVRLYQVTAVEIDEARVKRTALSPDGPDSVPVPPAGFTDKFDRLLNGVKDKLSEEDRTERYSSLFDESKHPRDHGKFASKPGIAGQQMGLFHGKEPAGQQKTLFNAVKPHTKKQIVQKMQASLLEKIEDDLKASKKESLGGQKDLFSLRNQFLMEHYTQGSATTWTSPVTREPVVSPKRQTVPKTEKSERQPGDGTPGWQRVGGAPVFVDGNGKITKGCPGLKGEHVADIIDEPDDSRELREVRQAHAKSEGLTGEEYTAQHRRRHQTKKAQSQHAAAKESARQHGVATHKVLATMPEVQGMESERNDGIESARQRARAMTGMTAGRIAAVENGHRDHSTVEGFEANARDFASERPDLFDKDAHDTPARVWDFIREGADRSAQDERTRELATQAAELVANSNTAVSIPADNGADDELWDESEFEDEDDSLDFGANLKQSLQEKISDHVPF